MAGVQVLLTENIKKLNTRRSLRFQNNTKLRIIKYGDKMKFKELINTLQEYENRDAQVQVEQPNPFQLVITISK